MTLNELKTGVHRKRTAGQDGRRKAVCRTSFTGRKINASTLNDNNELKDRDYLIRRYAHLVNWIVNRMPVSTLGGIDRDDLVGYGTIGLIEAVDRFDPSKNTSFESFAIMRIRGSVYDYLRASDWLSRGERKTVKNLIKITNILECKLGRYPNSKELADELFTSPEE